MKKPKLFEMQLTAFKTFFVEAKSKAEALNHEVTQQEMSWAGDVEWEPDESTAMEVDASEEKFIREKREHLIRTRYPQTKEAK